MNKKLADRLMKAKDFKEFISIIKENKDLLTISDYEELLKVLKETIEQKEKEHTID